VAPIAGLIVDLLLLADIADQRFDVKHRELRLIRRVRTMRGAGRDLDPDRRAIDLADTDQMIGDPFVAIEQLDEGLARLRVDKERWIERLDEGLRRVRRIPEDCLEVRIGGEGRSGVRSEGADIDTLANVLE